MIEMSSGARAIIHPIQQDHKKNAAGKSLILIFLIIAVVATLQLIQGHYHIKRFLRNSEGTSTASNNRNGVTNVKDRLRKFLESSREETHYFFDVINKNNNNNINNNVTFSNPLHSIFDKAGIPLTPNVMEQIPPYSDIVKMYGKNPIILGLDKCEEFQKHVQPPDRTIAVAGMFNTGTNLLERLLSFNCENPFRDKSVRRQDNAGILWQVAWGKHSPASFRLVYKNEWSKGLNELHALPIVVTKDPYSWMESLCRHPYSAFWKHSLEHCPNLVPNEVDVSLGFIQDKEHKEALKQNGIPVTIRYAPPRKVTHNNLAEAWNTWYGDYINAHYPRLFVRFEDLLFNTETVITQACHCFGGQLKDESNFNYHVDSAKPDIGAHHGGSGLTEALLKYSNANKRVKSFTKDDLDFANKVLNKTMMDLFHYSIEAIV